MPDKAMPAHPPARSSCASGSAAPQAGPERVYARPEPLPDLRLPAPPMELFDPDRHALPYATGSSAASGPALPLYAAAKAHPERSLVPRKQDCYALWDRYRMMDHIREHSAKVASLAYAIARLAWREETDLRPKAVLAAGLLHDLAKTYTIAHKGNHAQLGASWVMRETRNGPIARAVLFHVYWPWEESVDDDLFPIMAVLYADKRVRHDAYVSLDDRFEDLLERYGVNERARWHIGQSHQQGKRIEAALSRRLGVNLDEHSIDSGRLVKRA